MGCDAAVKVPNPFKHMWFKYIAKKNKNKKKTSQDNINLK